MNYQVLPIILAVRACRAAGRRMRLRRAHWVLFCGIVFTTAGILLAQPLNAPPVPPGYETAPIVDPFERARMLEAAHEETERYRMRVSVPQAAFAKRLIKDPPRSSVSSAGFADSGARDFTILLLKFLCLPVGVILWYRIAQRIAPEVAEYMATWAGLRALSPAVAGGRMTTLLAEEQAVADFQAALSAAAPKDEIIAEPLEGYAFNAKSPAAQHIREIRRLLTDTGRVESHGTQRDFLLAAMEHIHSLKEAAKPAELTALRQMATAVEMLFKQLSEKAINVTSSTLRTAALGVNALQELSRPGLQPGLLSDPPLRILAVDDETFSRFALSHSLKRGIGEPDVSDNAAAALNMAERRTYDLIVLDVQMPGMDGFELCSKIHETAANRTTPVIFVTSLRDFDARANSIIAGGRDLIAKPFLTFELTVKALTLVSTERLRGRGLLAETAVDELPVEQPMAAIEVAAPGEAVAPLPPEPVVSMDNMEAAQTAAALPEVPETAAPSPAPASDLKSKLPPGLPPMPANMPRRDRKTSPYVSGELTEENWQLELSQPDPGTAFVDQVRAQIVVARGIVELIRETSDVEGRQGMMAELFVAMHLVAEVGEAKGQLSIALVASSLEGLLKKLLENVSNLSQSTIEIMQTAVDLALDLCGSDTTPDLATNPPIRALVVDDDPIALRAFSNAMQIKFSKPDTASDGRFGLALAMQKPYDVIFLDVYMPDLDGFEVCTRIRENSPNRPTPVVFLTASDSPALREKSELCGGTDFLTKTCLASELNLKALVMALRARLDNVNLVLAELAACGS
jgi:CheY-like chemotaxis protein/HPt (histidine-containing phosphotransfer) domain-containing protein